MLDKIFNTDEMPNYKVYEMAHQVVSDYMELKRCKIDLVATELGTTTGVLYRQLNPKDTQMPLSIDRIIAITRLTKDHRIIEEINKEFDLIAIPRVCENANLSDINLLVDIANIENNDVFKITKMSIANGVISSEEQAAILKEIDEAQKANAQLKDMVMHIVIKNS